MIMTLRFGASCASDIISVTTVVATVVSVSVRSYGQNKIGGITSLTLLCATHGLLVIMSTLCILKCKRGSVSNTSTAHCVWLLGAYPVSYKHTCNLNHV